MLCLILEIDQRFNADSQVIQIYVLNEIVFLTNIFPVLQITRFLMFSGLK